MQAELPVVDGENLRGIQAKVGRIGPEETADVDVAQDRVERLPLQGLEVFRPDAGLTARLFDGLAS